MDRLTMTDAEMAEIKKHFPEFDCPVKAEEESTTQHFCDAVCDEFENVCPFKEMSQKLKLYEDLEEQGKLLRLPCKVGDTAYYLHRVYLKNADKWIDEIDAVEVDSFMLNINLFVNVFYRIGGDMFRKTLTPYKTLFFTKEEAEQALQKMKGE